jgi:hypothetical protein
LTVAWLFFDAFGTCAKANAVATKIPGSRNTPDPFLHPSDLPRVRDHALLLFARRFMDALRRGIASDQ